MYVPFVRAMAIHRSKATFGRNLIPSYFPKYFMLLIIVISGSVIVFVLYTNSLGALNFQLKPKLEMYTNLDARSQFQQNGTRNTQGHEYSPPTGSDVTLPIDTVLELARHVNTASLHTRSMKAQLALKQMELILKHILKNQELDYKKETMRRIHHPRSVCPEKWMGGKADSPMNEKSFQASNCSNDIRLSEFISIVYVPTHDTFVRTVLDGITKWLPGVTVYLGSYSHHRNLTHNIIESQFSKSSSYGNMLNTILSYVKTKYVFIAHNLTEVDEYVSLKRLVRAIETVGVSVASGSSRDIEGKWRRGCFQRAYSRYSLVYQDGYDESADECLICDDVTSSFVIETSKIRNISFDENLNAMSIFKDLFINLGLREAVVCSDVMFHVENDNISAQIEIWKLFARKWEVHKIKFPFNEVITMPCAVLYYSCKSSKYYILHPCCRAELSTMIQHVNDVCNENGILCEIADGTALGAVKFSDILPWEIDADIFYHIKDLNKIFASKAKFAGRSFKFHLTEDPIYDKSGNILEATHILNSLISQKWFVEIYGVNNMTSSLRTGNTSKPRTRILLDGHWVYTYYNPGLAVRGRYGLNIYKHAQHWRVLRTDSWIQYPTGRFVTCPTPGDHKCIDNLKNDGNLQLSDPLP